MKPLAVWLNITFAVLVVCATVVYVVNEVTVAAPIVVAPCGGGHIGPAVPR